MEPLIEQLKKEPALAWKLAVGVLGASADSPEVKQAAGEVFHSPLVERLLEGIDTGGSRQHVYSKWTGAHWVLSLLADLGYPSGQESLKPLLDDCYHAWLGEHHQQYIRTINGRVRRCASQEGNTVWYSVRLGLADGRTEELISRLLKWQWQDGGWNCDKNPQADTSSFMETLIPLRGLALYAGVSGDPAAGLAASRAAEVFLKRRLFRRLADGTLMDKHFIRLHYPAYWHYDILFGLKVMAEAGFISDPRCGEALDWLESKRLPDRGFPADESYSRTTNPSLSGYSLVNWGGISRKEMNPFVTVDALYVLRAAGRTSASSVLPSG
jgi:hypothetical protein